MIESILRAGAGSTESDYRLAPHVIFLRIQDGSARLLDLGGNFYSLSQTAAQMLDETLKVGQASTAVRIAIEYDVALALIKHDLLALLHDLEEKRLICHKKLPRCVFWRKNILPSLVCVPLLRCVSVCPVSLEKKAWALLALASVAIRLFGWPETVASWQYSLGRKQGHDPMDSVTTELEQSASDIDKAVRTVAARHPLHVECKERALSCWWLLHAADFSAQLVVGVDLFPLASHCWCEMGPFVLSDSQERCQRFTSVISYGG